MTQAIQNYVLTKKPTTPIEAIFDDFNLQNIKTIVASQADVCLAFLNADSGEGV